MPPCQGYPRVGVLSDRRGGFPFAWRWSNSGVARPVAHFRQGGEQMRLFVASVLVAGTGFAPASGHAQWTDAKIAGEQHRTVQACAAEARNPGDWVCILVRCDRPGSPPGLYFSTP